MPDAPAPQVRFEPLGSGAIGSTSEVFRARDRSTGRIVAFKVGRHPAARSILAAEARRLALAPSPYIPELIDVGLTPEGAPFVAVTWIEGEALDTGAELSPAERRRLALVVARDIGAALADLHAAGVAHGDVKPANIIIGAGRATARLVDLGLAGPADEAAIGGATPRYLPPEVWRSQSAGDARARDRFALGVVLAEILDPSIAAAPNGAERARAGRFAAPFDGWCAALLAADPAARARASWLSEQARRELEPAGSDEASGAAAIEEALGRRLRAVRNAYLASRAVELSQASRSSEVSLGVEGLPAEWLRHAVDRARRSDLLEGLLLSSGAVRLGDADPFARARWLVDLVGPPAAAWPVGALPAAGDQVWAEALLDLARTREPRAWSIHEVRGAITSALAARGSPAPAKPIGPIERNRVRIEPPLDRAGADAVAHAALALAAPAPDPEVIDAIERGALDIPALRCAAADALRRTGQTGRALALLIRAGDEPETCSLRAEVARRAGEHALARAEAERALARAPDDDRAASVLSRLLIDAGNPAGALERLAAARTTARTTETRVLALATRGDIEAAQIEIDFGFSLATTEEQRARLSGLAGFVLHQKGDGVRAGQAYAAAAAHASRAGAVEEEATYRTGEAAAAVERGDIGRALEAALRAALLWEHLGRPADAARALLARAAAYAIAGARDEAIGAAREARQSALAAGDTRAAAYCAWPITDVLPAGNPHAQRAAHEAHGAFALGASSVSADDKLRALSRVLRHDPEAITQEAAAWGDETAAREDAAAAARLDWWRVRAERAAAGRAGPRPADVLAELGRLSGRQAPIASRGPAFAAGAALATQIGDAARYLIFSAAQKEAAQELLSHAPSELRDQVSAVPWVAARAAAEASPLLPEQIAEAERFLRSLGSRERLRPLLEHVLDSLVMWSGVERGLLLLMAPTGKLVPRVARNFARADLSGEQLRLSQTLARRALERGEPVVAVDASGELASVHASVHALKLRSVLAVPLVARGHTLGVVYLDDRVRRGAFGERELAWVKLVGSLAAAAVADARDQIMLRRAVRRAERAQQALARELSARDLALDAAERELARARESRDTRFRYDAIVGRSPPIEKMLRLVDRVTASEVPVLVIGESGSGKELVARAIHANGRRGAKVFVGENCAAIPEPLLESTLFGHARGAFTGADRPRAGLFEVANGGTLFLDEIGEMSLAMQSKLLRVLEEREVRPLGSERGRAVDVRIIAATHRNLEQMVAERRFREDLFYRLHVITIRVPPLRERADDIPLLIQYFLEKHGGGRKVRVAREALALLRAYEWPGNVRQLENEVRRALVLSDGTIEPEHLSAPVQTSAEAGRRSATGLRLRERIDALEEELVREALARTHGNQTRAAELLGLSRFGLQKMIRRLAIKT